MTHPPRLTVAALIGLVAFCAASFAALRTSSPYWASAMVSLTVLALLGSVVACVWGRHRVGWSGFAIFGWGYFILAFCSPFRDVVRPHMLTSVAIVESYRHVHPEVRLDMMNLARLPLAGVPVGPALLVERIPHLPAPQFVAVAEAGPNRLSTAATAPTSPPAQTASTPSSARLTPRSRSHSPGSAGCSPPSSPIEPRRYAGRCGRGPVTIAVELDPRMRSNHRRHDLIGIVGDCRQRVQQRSLFLEAIHRSFSGCFADPHIGDLVYLPVKEIEGCAHSSAARVPLQ